VADTITTQTHDESYYFVSGDFDSINHGSKREKNFATWHNQEYLDLINRVDTKVNEIISPLINDPN
jgi:hypothetical protein